MNGGGLDRLVKLAEHFEARHREHADAARAQADSDASRPERASSAVYRMCAEQLRDVIGDLATPTAADYDRAAEEIAKPAARYALVEQMGHRATVATIRETTFCGKQMIEATDLKGGSTSLIAPESLYEVTWLTEDQAHTRVKPWTATALPLGAVDLGDPWGVSESDDDESARELAAEGNATAMSDAERAEYDRDGEAWLDAQDEADEMASVHLEDDL